MRADASTALRFNARATYLDLRYSFRERDLRVVKLFATQHLGADDRAFAPRAADTAPLDQRARFLERGPAADLGEEVGIEFEHRKGWRWIAYLSYFS